MNLKRCIDECHSNAFYVVDSGKDDDEEERK
jgi:hypothetical protein